MSRPKVDVIHSDEETVVEDDDDRTVATAKSGKSKAGEQKEPTEELLKTKRPRHNKPFTEDILMSVAGLPRIYNEFPLACSKYPITRGSEAAYLKRLITLYKEWAFQLHPGLSFEDVVLKCETLGSKGRIRGYMQQMRENERDRYIDEMLMPLIRAREEQDAEMLKSMGNSKGSNHHKKHKRRHDHDEGAGEDIPTQAERSSKENDGHQLNEEDGDNTQQQAHSSAAAEKKIINDDPFEDDEEFEFDIPSTKRDDADSAKDETSRIDGDVALTSLSNESAENFAHQTGKIQSSNAEESHFDSASDNEENEPTQQQ